MIKIHIYMKSNDWETETFIQRINSIQRTDFFNFLNLQSYSKFCLTMQKNAKRQVDGLDFLERHSEQTRSLKFFY